MEDTAKKQRRRVRRKPVVPSLVRIETKDPSGNRCLVTADLVDIIEGGGCGLELKSPLQSGSHVVVRGTLGKSQAVEYLKACVRWCVGAAGGTFRAGLEFPGNRSTSTSNQGNTNANTLDCYEVMQISPNADPETISRVYRMLAFRYHPDNTETGDNEKFIRLSEAYRTLSDPKTRASYDVRYRAAQRFTSKVFAEAQNPERLDLRARVKVSYQRGSAGNHVQTVGALGGWGAAMRLS